MPVGGPSFGSVRKAREALRERAHELLLLYLDGMKMALAAGDYETFQKGMQYLMAHVPKDEDGQMMLEMDVDKPKQIETQKSNGPAIQMGIVIGGLNRLPEASDAEKLALPDVTVIEVNPDESTD